MEPEVLLRSACELSYQVAREGLETEPALDAPVAMRGFLYAADLTPDALTSAQQAIEDDPAFRRRVATAAMEADVGRAGYLWLHRPIGWASEFEALSAAYEAGPDFDHGPDSEPDFDQAPAPEPDLGDGYADVEAMPFADQTSIDDGDPIVDAQFDVGTPVDVDPGTTTDLPAGSVNALGFGSVDGLSTQGPLAVGVDEEGAGETSEANAFENELSSLRGLVDRLSKERRAVSTSMRRVEADVQTSRTQPSMFDSDIYSLQSELESSRTELDRARAERDLAVQQRSESLTRQLQLERELERSRELRAELERNHASADSDLIELREKVARTESLVTTVEVERDESRQRLDELVTTNEALNRQIAQMADEQSSKANVLQSEYDRVVADLDGLRVEREELAGSVSTLESEMGDVRAQLTQAVTQANEAQSLVDALTEEKIDLASRLADTEAMLETTRAQVGAVKSDSEALSADLANVKAHRDALASQVDDLHNSLSEALNDLARIRSTSDEDRNALKDVRAERDLLRVRVGSLEQIETGLEAKMANVTAERESLAAKVDGITQQVADLEAERKSLVDERDRKTAEASDARKMAEGLTSTLADQKDEFDRVQIEITDLRINRDNLQQQVEQLNEENSSLQAQVVEGERLRIEASENQGHAVSELAQRLSLVENERSRLESDLAEAEGRLSDALVAAETATEEASTLRRRLTEVEASAPAQPMGSAAPVSPPSSLPPINPLTPAPSPSGRLPVDPPPPPPPSPGDLVEPAAPLPPPPAPFGSADAPADVDADADSSANGAGPMDIEPAVPVTGSDLEDLRPPVDDEPRVPVDSPVPFGPTLDAEIDDVTVADSDDDAADSVVEPPRRGLAARRGWGRSGRRADRDPVETDTEAPAADDLFDDTPSPESVAAALAETLDEGPEDAPSATDGEDELDLISSELSAVVGEAPPVEPEEEDLDAISDLISQTITDFDPSSGAAPSGRAPERRTGSSSADDRGSLPPPPAMGGGSTSNGPDAGGTPDPDRVDETSVLPAGGSGRPGTTSGRRQIEIPPEVAEDEVEMARHVVSSPDVVLLVDGDAVAKMGWPSLPVAQQRDALVSYLADLSATSGAAPDVVFDGRIGEEESLPASRSVRIRLSTPPTEPAAALDELVDAYPEQWPIAIVTDDSSLGRSASDRGAVVLNNGQLLDLFLA